MEGGGAYGAGKATGRFDPLAFVKKPQVILRAVSWLFSIIVFGCIASEGWNEDACAYNYDANACGFGITIGVLAFLGLMGFLVLDAFFENITSVQQRKYIVIADIAFSGIWTFLWFVCFCYLADGWRKQVDKDDFTRSAVEAAIAFSFFSIATFAALTVLAVMRYRQGVTESFAQPGSYDEPGGVGGVPQPTPSPYSAYPGSGGGESTEPYQQGPFSGQPQPYGVGPTETKQAPPGDFQPPTY